jgi:hypothetical protein
MIRLLPFLIVGVIAFVAYYAWFCVRYNVEKVLPKRKVSFLDDPAPMSVVYENSKYLSPDEIRRDFHRGFFQKTSTRAALFKFSRSLFVTVFILFPLGLFSIFGIALFLASMLLSIG